MLSQSVAGIVLESPLMLASGILDQNGYTMKRVLESGAAAVVTKSIGVEPREGYFPPIVSVFEGGLLNAVGLSNPGIIHIGTEISIAKEAGKPVIGSIFGATPDEFLRLGSAMEDMKVSGVELNLSCPHVKGVGAEVGSDPALVKQIVSALKGSLSIPVFSKLSPNVSSVLEIATAASDSDGLVLINTVKGMAVDIYARRPVLSNMYGGLSGPAIKPVGIRYVYEVKKELDPVIIGVGGIETADDAIEYMMAGASAVQIGTALMKHGISVFSTIKKGVAEFLEKEGIKSVSEIVGVAVQ
ncbi:MAG: dihydroorotate dehydrogenase [Candidatus Thermoplasmatota archaeon]|nr:dihydroorotate dehydrogenase [Candidatus Thermoplasmatota archaeon]